MWKNVQSDALRELLQINVPLLNPQQEYVFDKLMKIVNDGTGVIYFWDVPCGTRKIFLISLILAIRSHNEIALALASSGIAATLLEGGRKPIQR
jgi:PIF1 helicase.